MKVATLLDTLKDFISVDINENYPYRIAYNTVKEITQSNFPRVYFLGEHYGVMLHPFEIDNPHIHFTILEEVQSHWYVREYNNDSFILSDLHDQLGKAVEWCKNNALPDMYKGRGYGYKFKPIE